jgi:SAM-dependent methyltransferase
MHTSSMLRMKWFKETYLLPLIKEIECIKVIDFGSQCVPGQQDTYKTYFNEKTFEYIGIDMIKGNNVDIVLKRPYHWEEIPDDFCDVLISGQVFEHIEFPWFTIQEIARVVRPNGIICIIVPSMQTLHRYPVNCQNYFSDGMIALAKYAGLEVLHASTNLAPINASPEWYNRGIQDTMIIEKKPSEWKKDCFNKYSYVCEVADLDKIATGLIPLEQQPWYKKYIIKENVKKLIKIILWPIVILRRKIIKNK